MKQVFKRLLAWLTPYFYDPLSAIQAVKVAMKAKLRELEEDEKAFRLARAEYRAALKQKDNNQRHLIGDDAPF